VNGGEPIECLTEEVKDAIMKNIRRRMTPQPVKIRADVELTCFSYDGILHIQVSFVLCGLTPAAGCVVDSKTIYFTATF
jgi:translation initiation factor 2 subunit 1